VTQFSIVTPVYAPPLSVLRDTLRSVTEQTFSDWEWILVDDHSPDEQVRVELRSAAAADPRVKVVERPVNGHIVAASNDGLAAASGEFVVFLDHDDLLVPHALARMNVAIREHPHADYLYSDEDKIDANGGDAAPRYYDVFRKPDWSPERLRGQMYTSHLSVIRRALALEVGAFRTGFEGSQDHDLVLRVTERARDVVHVPEVLYHWRIVPGSAAGDIDAKPYAAVAGARAVQESLERQGIKATVEHVPGAAGHYRINRRLPLEARVSLVIPTRGGAGLVWGRHRTFVVETVRSALAKAGHDNLEVVVVYDTGTPSQVLDKLRKIAGDRLVLVEYTHPFNFSEKINVGVLHSTGAYVIPLNDDVEVVTDRWVPQLVGPLLEPDVGMTGAKLYFSDSTIQHAGHQYTGDQYSHPYLGTPGTSTGTLGDLLVNHEVSGVTAACAAIRRDVFFQVGGFSETLPVNFNDVDFSYKVRRSGHRIVWVANCELFHFESRTRAKGIEPWEHFTTLERWGRTQRDPYMPVP
jgi:glycosyltransferase involved in cell wall biosynthesis